MYLNCIKEWAFLVPNRLSYVVTIGITKPFSESVEQNMGSSLGLEVKQFTDSVTLGKCLHTWEPQSSLEEWGGELLK